MYENIRTKLNKFADGGKIPKYQTAWGNGILPMGQFELKMRLKQALREAGIADEDMDSFLSDPAAMTQITAQSANSILGINPELKVPTVNATPGQLNDGDISKETDNATAVGEVSKLSLDSGYLSGWSNGVINDLNTKLDDPTLSADEKFKLKLEAQHKIKVGKGLGIGAEIGTKAIEAVDQLAMGDKNFGAQSQAIDGAVHAASGALMKSGNPYAMAAGAALEGANFLTKAGGQTVQGYDVDINNSGYGTLGHMESSSSRDFGAMFGLGGLNRKSMEDKLAKRNELAKMALTAAEISEDSSFQLEARMNSIENTIMNNLIALAGGLQTNMISG